MTQAGKYVILPTTTATAMYSQNSSCHADSKAVNKWHTKQGGVYIAAGVNGPITGRGFHLGIIDDPVKGAEDGDSPTMQDKTIKWYRSDFFSRRMKNNAVVAIGTRWNENDLFGWLLQRMAEGGEQWVHLCFPAIRR